MSKFYGLLAVLAAKYSRNREFLDTKCVNTKCIDRECVNTKYKLITPTKRFIQPVVETRPWWASRIPANVGWSWPTCQYLEYRSILRVERKTRECVL